MKVRTFIQRYALTLTLLLAGAAIVLLAVASGQNNDFSHALANERTQSIYRACTDQNARHDHTIAQLNGLLAKALKAHPERKAQILESRGPTILLIDALAPHQDCGSVVAKNTTA